MCYLIFENLSSSFTKRAVLYTTAFKHSLGHSLPVTVTHVFYVFLILLQFTPIKQTPLFLIKLPKGHHFILFIHCVSSKNTHPYCKFERAKNQIVISNNLKLNDPSMFYHLKPSFNSM